MFLQVIKVVILIVRVISFLTEANAINFALKAAVTFINCALIFSNSAIKRVLQETLIIMGVLMLTPLFFNHHER